MSNGGLAIPDLIACADVDAASVAEYDRAVFLRECLALPEQADVLAKQARVAARQREADGALYVAFGGHRRLLLGLCFGIDRATNGA